MILRNQIKSFTEQTIVLLGHENKNIDTLHKNIAFFQNELTEENKITKFLMKTQTSMLDAMRDLKQQPNTSEQNVVEHLSQNNKFNQISHSYRNKDHSREEQCKRNKEIAKENKIMYLGNLHETVTKSDLGAFFDLRTTIYLKGDCSIKFSKLQENGRRNGDLFHHLVMNL